MMSTLNPHDDRDALSALFDGELQGDAARFALKRLAHDPQWRESFSRWQLAGDAMRGRATAAAPLDFADGVAARLARESAATVVPIAMGERVAAGEHATVVASGSSAGALSRRRWLGGAALAASVAMAALFVGRPFSGGDVAPASTPIVADAPATTPVAAAPAAAEPAAAAPVLAASAVAVAVAEAPRRAAERRSRGQSQRAALRAQQRTTQVVAAAASSAAPPVVVATSAAPASADPFRPLPADTITARPWPRAALPNYPATGALTASSGASLASAPSFYPFEPRLDPSAAPSSDAGPQP
ncbi:sigma-E factor negative regulatory protein [Cognatilysobacter tabacisoli]|uniref:sigma-E factor negative regulatory protein n=1 Tax=Cognatilysobacter tabacisoli TaxID=2315424 RepID=UPI000E6AEFC6|nr:sigma-E factor negative regulatory protein [Lysobacter tabacisoli]